MQPRRSLQKAGAGLIVGRQKRLDLAPQRRIAGASLIEEDNTLLRGKLHRPVQHVFNLFPPLGSHRMPPEPANLKHCIAAPGAA